MIMEQNNVEILLVEDNASDAELTIRALKKRHLANNLIHVKDGAQALDFLFGEGQFGSRDATQVPKVILLDLKMPKISGIEVLMKIRSDDRTRAIPVVVLTSSREDPDVAACYKLGVNSYIVKPVEFDNFVAAVSDLGFYWLILNHPPLL
jgi:two-component system, response regulator